MKCFKLIVTLSLVILTISYAYPSPEVRHQAKVPPKRPHIIFIYADDWGYGDLSRHGSSWLKTPNLDKLAQQGSDFHHFNVVNPVCSPSRAALLTGHYPARYSIHEHFASHEENQRRGMPDWLDPDAPTLPRMLRVSGYATAHYGKWHLTNGEAIPYAPHPSVFGYDDYAGWNGPKPAITKKDVFDKTLKFIEEAERMGKPAFVNLWMHETHTPHSPSEHSKAGFSNLGEQQQVYAAVVKEGDDGVGKLMTGLEALGLTENTLIIFSSDNGPEKTGTDKTYLNGLGTYYSLGQTGGLKGQKRSLYEGGVRVPFIIRWPGKVKSGYNDHTSAFSAVDVLPTICNIAGAAIPADYKADGEDKTNVWLGTPEAHKKPIFWDWRGNSAGMNWPRSAVRDGDWKLLIDNSGKVELYNMKTDQKETKNVAGANVRVVNDLKKKIAAWKATLPLHADPDHVIPSETAPSPTLSLSEPFSYMWWMKGFKTADPKRFAIKTNYYAMAFDYTNISLKTLIFNKGIQTRAGVLRESEESSFPVSNNMKSSFGFTINGQDENVVKSSNVLADCQLIESGNLFHRRFLSRLPALNQCDPDKSGLEISSWPNRLSMLLKFIPTTTLTNRGVHVGLEFPAGYSSVIKIRNIIGLKNPVNGRGFVIIRSKDATSLEVVGTKVTARMAAKDCLAGTELNVGLSVYPVEKDFDAKMMQLALQEDFPVKVVAQQIVPQAQDLQVAYDVNHGWHEIALRNDNASGKGDVSNRRMERVKLQLKNDAQYDKEVRLNFAKGVLGGVDANVHAITGISVIIRDENGNPTGVPVQISKNWHKSTSDPISHYFEGAWYHGLTTINVPGKSTVTLEYTSVNGMWGKVPAASHAQLSLVGWGGNQQWDESAIGCWGESITYSPDFALGGSPVLDFRPLMVSRINGETWNWSGNVGGADFFNITNTAGQRNQHSRMRTDYKKIGPNVTEVIYAGTTMGGEVDLEYTTTLGRSEDITRGIYRLKMKVLKDFSFNDFVIFQAGAPNYHAATSGRLSYGDESGLKKTWSPTNGTIARYVTPKEILTGKTPWFSFTNSTINDKQFKAADRGFVIRNWKSKINGVDNIPPYFAEYNATEGYGANNSIINITTPLACTSLKAGDYIECDVELFILPKTAADYYGPNQPLKDSLAKYAGTWKMAYDEAVKNTLEVTPTGEGKVQTHYPIKIAVDNSKASFSVTGGKGYVPVTFTHVASYKGHKLSFMKDGKLQTLNQEDHGNDFWQVDKNESNGTYDISYNVNLDGADTTFFEFGPATGLSALTTTRGINPAFHTDSISYHVLVDPGTENIRLTATELSAGSTLQLVTNGAGAVPMVSGVETGDLNLKIGDNIFEVLVSLPNETLTKTYTVTVKRPNPDQPIKFAATREVTYGDQPFDPGATSETSSVNPITYTSSDNTVADVLDGKVYVRGAGTVTLTAAQAAGSGYLASDTSQILTVQPKGLVIRADDKQKATGQDNPPLTATYEGFVNGEATTVLTAPVQLSTTATKMSPTGSYPIKASGAQATNYSISYVEGKLIVTNFERPMTSFEPLTINISSDKGSSIVKGETANLTATGAKTYQWENANGILSGQSTSVLTVAPDKQTTYTVVGTNELQQKGTSSFTLNVKQAYEALSIMNVITPNGDGKNDLWLIDKIDSYPNNTVRVIDAAGKIVFSMVGYNNTWGGTFEGAVLPEGNYSYLVDFGPDYGVRKGTISILKQ